MMICPVCPRGPGVRSTASRPPSPLRPKAIQPGEPTRPGTAASGRGDDRLCRREPPRARTGGRSREVQLVQREQIASDRLAEVFRRRRGVVAPVFPPRPRYPVEHLQLSRQRDAEACFRGGDLSLGGTDGARESLAKRPL